MHTFNLSANIENGFAEGTRYIVTPNARKAIHNIVNDFHSGIHSFTIIGTYGTGKSCFLLALESDLQKKRSEKYLIDSRNLSVTTDSFEFLNILGDYAELSILLSRKLNIEGSSSSIFDDLKSYYNRCRQKGKFLVIVVDEFGKILEHAAKNNPEKELYFMQKLAEFVNVPSRNILLLTTLHQNFSSYARGLTEEQYNEWTKVKGRFKEITFVEPVEQLLQLASEQLQEDRGSIAPPMTKNIFLLAKNTRFVTDDFSEDVARKLYPLDTFSAYAITTAIQRYGQNERSLFTFLSSKGENSISEFEDCEFLTYNLENVYDYILYNFYSYLKDANADSMSWSSIQVAIERVEGQDWESKEQMLSAVKIVKALGLLNLFGKAGFRLTENDMAEYAMLAMHIQSADRILKQLKSKKIIRYAAYKERLMLFEGTDIDLEAEIRDAGMIVPRPVAFVDELRMFFNKRISPVKAHYYHKGTPRFFDYRIEEEPLDITPSGDTDGYIELIFSTSKNALNVIKDRSENSNNALIFAYFNNTEDIVEHLYNINKYRYLLERVINKEDRVAVQEIQNLKEYEETLLNKTISDNLFGYGNHVIGRFY